MSRIDNIIARIPFMDPKALANLRDNAQNTLKNALDDKDANRVLSALDAFEDADDRPQRLKVNGLLEWEKRPHNKQFIFRAFHEGRVVGKIFKRANHSGTEKDVYTVEILELQLSGKFHHIKDARAAGEIAFVEQNARSKSQNTGNIDPQDG